MSVFAWSFARGEGEASDWSEGGEVIENEVRCEGCDIAVNGKVNGGWCGGSGGVFGVHDEEGGLVMVEDHAVEGAMFFDGGEEELCELS